MNTLSYLTQIIPAGQTPSSGSKVPWSGEEGVFNGGDCWEAEDE